MCFYPIKNNLSLVFLLIAFIVLIGPFALNFHLRYPDEMYYTNAAIRMVQTGDFQTPYLGDGTLRFKKPILTYWFVLVPFKLFGISSLTSRLMFLLAGAMSIALSYWGALLFFNKKNIALLSACILSTLPIWIISSSRSIPDILLGLFITLGSVGIIGFLKYGNSTPQKFHWMLYTGFALAFAAKGLPAGFLCLVGILYLLTNPWQRIGYQKLFHLPSILFAVVIAAYWYLLMYQAHGSEFLGAFFEDQVGARVTGSFSWMITNLSLGIFSAVFLFAPWIFFGSFWKKNYFLDLKKDEKAFAGFVLVMVCCLILLSAFVVKFYSRYLIPVVPITSILLAWWLTKQNYLTNGRGFQIGIYTLLVINSMILILGMYLNIQFRSIPAVWLQLIFAIFALILIWYHSLSISDKSPLLFSLSILLAVFSISIVTYHLSLPDAGKSFNSFIAKNEVPKQSKIAYLGNLHVGSKIRIGIGSDYFMTDLQEIDIGEIKTNFDYVILEDMFLEKFQNKDFNLQMAVSNWNPNYYKEMILALLNGDLAESKWRYKKSYYWAIPENTKSDIP
jgi:4-amino-4-deoxy-L-arabinose transferase-like glycosyltransferase